MWRLCQLQCRFSRSVEIDLRFSSVDFLTNETTHIYLEADLTTNEQALSKWALEGEEVLRFKTTDDGVAFLGGLPSRLGVLQRYELEALPRNGKGNAIS